MSYDLASAVSRLDAARRGEPRPARGPTTQADDASAGPVLINMADLKAEPIRWLWPGRIPAGMLSIVAGDPGLGKSTLTSAIAAIVSTGGTWPDGGSCEAGGVLWLSAEDDPARVIVPRLDAHGADRTRIMLMEGIRRTTGASVAHPSLADDLPMIADAMERTPGCRLVIIDPISAYIGRTDANANAEVRAMLTPLKALAENTGAAFLLVQHFNKGGGANAVHRMSGSIGFVGAARTGYIVVRDPDDENRRLFLCAKSNIGPEANGLGFRIEGDPARIVFDDAPVAMTANDALAAASGNVSDDGALGEAIDFLTDFLAGGPRSWKDIKEAAKEAGIAPGTLRRAKARIGVESHKEGFSGGWVWRLPAPKVRKEAEDAHPQSMSTFDESAHLRPDLPPGW
ncbi:MAG: AAA family ATPase [Planctomycetes bacterium]|nr:AAA family ATPase [Planctomycetota bacterium]